MNGGLLESNLGTGVSLVLLQAATKLAARSAIVRCGDARNTWASRTGIVSLGLLVMAFGPFCRGQLGRA
jgi:hypothetical protein